MSETPPPTHAPVTPRRSSEWHGLLTSAVCGRQIAVVGTVARGELFDRLSQQGDKRLLLPYVTTSTAVNFAAMSYNTVENHGNENGEPALLGITIITPQDRMVKTTLGNALETGQFTVNYLPHGFEADMEILRQPHMTKSKLQRSGRLTPLLSETIAPPGLEQAYAVFECTTHCVEDGYTRERVTHVDQLKDLPIGRGVKIVGAVTHCRVQSAYLLKDTVDFGKLTLGVRLGGKAYGRITPENMFEPGKK